MEWTEDRESTEAKFFEAEYERLRYVAATRAKDLMILPYHNDKEEYFTAPTALQALEYAVDDKKKDIVEVINSSGLLGEKSKDPIPFDKISGFHDALFHPALMNKPSVKNDSQLQKKWEKLKTEIDKKMKEQHDASVHIMPVTAVSEEIRQNKNIKHLSEIIFNREFGSFGEEGGTFFHQLYELLLKYPKIKTDKLIAHSFKNTDLSGWTDAQKEKLKKASEKLVIKWQNSDLYKRLLQAEKLFIETHFLYNDKKDNIIYSGKIDLLFKDREQWQIVDLKSDNMNEKELKNKKVQEALDPYQFQIETYKKAVEQIMNIQISRASLYFLLDDIVI